ncbi:19841_t:CDS:2, partial [Funneliformis geosporum]
MFITQLNILFCDFAKKIHRLLDIQDKENEYRFWQLAIPSIKNQQKTNFLFTKIDQYLQEFLTPTMLKMHYEITIDISQATLRQLIKFVGTHNIKEIWAVSVENSLKAKHYIILLQNYGHICIANKFQIINLLQEFIENEDNEDTDENIGEHLDLANEFQQENDISNKKNDPLVLLLQYSNKRYNKGQPPGPPDTKRFKSIYEAPKTKNQCKCKKCENISHYQKIA